VASVGRIFFAIDLDLETRAILAAQVEDLEVPGKRVPAANWHLTLRYVGDLDEVRHQRLLADLDQIDLGEPFRIRFTDLGAFPNPRRATVLWRAVDDPAQRLGTLVDSIEETCRSVGLPAEDRPFRPHVTLSRIRPGRDVRSLVGGTDLSALEMLVTSVTVFRSHLGGPSARYEVMDTFELA